MSATSAANSATNSPATNRRRLRSELRRLRDVSGLSQADVVRKLDWSQSKLIRIENGSVGISVTDARALLGLYGGPSGVDGQLIEWARTSRVRTWWSAYRDVLTTAHQEFLGFEADASRLRQFHPTVVPGLLQIEAYTRALLPALAIGPEPESTYDSLVAVRQRRQKEILSGGSPELTVIIDEAALRRPVGGPRTMRRQLAHLAAMQGQRQVSLAVLPFSAGPHIGMAGAFHLMDFADDDLDASVLYLEGAAGEVSLRDNPAVVARYSDRFTEILGRCHTGAAATEFLLLAAASAV